MNRPLSLTLGAALATAAFATTHPAVAMHRYGVFVYSDLCIDPQGGDYAGHRVTVSRFREHDLVNYEWSEGPMEAVRADKVQIATNGQLTFDADLGRGDGTKTADHETFTGRMTEFGLTGVFSHGSQSPTTLHRVQDFNRPAPHCR